MSIQRFDPFRDALSLRDAMNRLFEESFIHPAQAGALPAGTALGFPIDLEDSQDAFALRASLPGFRPEEVDVTVVGDTLTIRAEHRDQQGQENRNYLLRERRVGAVVRTLTLPERVQADQAQARFEDGELLLTLPKAPENRPRQIQINVGGQQQLGGGQQGTGGQQHGAASDQAQVEQARGTQTGPATGPGQHGGQGEPIPQVQEGLRQQGGPEAREGQ